MPPDALSRFFSDHRPEGEGRAGHQPPHALLAGTRAPGVAASWDDRLAGRVGADGAQAARGSAPQALAAAVFPPFVAEIREIIPEMAFSRGILPRHLPPSRRAF